MSRVIGTILDTRNVNYQKNISRDNLKIYNIFTRFFTGPKQWLEVAKKAQKMGFNTIYLNPFQKMGASQSLYSIVDYFDFDHSIIVGLSHEKSIIEIKKFIKECKEIGLSIVMDFVSNHTGIDSELTKLHSDWYEKDEHGNIAKAWCMSDSGKCVWEDCAKLDYSNPNNGLWDYMESVCRYYLDMGFSGFRCDVAAYVPKNFWKHLISSLKKDYPSVIFMGEAFMVPQETIDGLAEAGFDFIFNSAKWWNGVDAWFYEQNSHYNQIELNTISFPDNHDTKPLMTDINGNIPLFKQRLFFTAVLTSAFEITSGFEYGIQTDYHVINSRPEDIQNMALDFTSDISKALKLRDSYEILHTSGELTNIFPNSHEVLFLQKESIDPINPQKALIVLNLTKKEIDIDVQTILSAFPIDNPDESIHLAPYDFKVYVANADLAPKFLENISYCLTSKQTMTKKRLPIKPLYANEALVEIKACGICGSDRREFLNGRFFWKTPESGGHELVGKVIQIGKLCKKISEGDIVCYRIPRQYTGIAQFGGFSKYAVIRESCLYKLPLNVNIGCATMIEPLACAVHTASMLKSEKNIAIIGSGTIAILLARYLNLTNSDKNIYLIYKHESVCKFVNEKICCIPLQHLNKSSMFSTPKKFDTIIECSGDASIFKKLLSMLAVNGRIIVTGIYKDRKSTRLNSSHIATSRMPSSA